MPEDQFVNPPEEGKEEVKVDESTAAPETKVDEPKLEDTPGESRDTDETKVDEPKEVNFQDFLKDRGVEFEPTLEKVEEKVKPKTQPRVLDDIPEEDRPLFKNMSNESFNKLKPLYLE